MLIGTNVLILLIKILFEYKYNPGFHKDYELKDNRQISLEISSIVII